LKHKKGSDQEPFLCEDVRRQALLDLIEGAVMSYGEVFLDRAIFFDAKNAVELTAVRCGPGRCKSDLEAAGFLNFL
jgi:hypothetical protein